MGTVATRADQLISQTHHLYLSSPPSGTPGNVPGNMDTTGTLDPSISMDAAAGAQPPGIMSTAGLPFAAALPTSSDDRCEFSRTARCREDSLDHGCVSNWVHTGPISFEELPNEVLFHILGFLDVSDLLSASRTSHLIRSISCSPILHYYRLQYARSTLPLFLWSSSRPSLADLIARRVFLTNNSVVSRRLARSLVSIRLAHRLAARPSAETLVERAVLPKECVPGMNPVHVAPGLVAKKKAIERERVKDVMRRWVAAKWRGEVRERQEGMRRWEESRGVGRVWRLRRFWERVSRGEDQAIVPAIR